ncbi:FKBP-type peptidyl-prolyl cis-trans isomerase [Cytophagales bacterium LB-30]|uniref:Peptidyl-prolyl cis-trans isomerase n=1 Tax=Shiella aurantiaca TaxID=3058365 RepID=A0ABT8F9D6_9BACT|nr:FKBP-type peptidyl-prolyl cis-trans isomerase [Shiella aurantiaca]MDN4166811.1 FKBP-type peptidyl-prolyl cis-trans isomerase [Shiella aurantiaca]
MIIEKNKVVELTYELWVDKGDGNKEFKEKTTKENPLAFLFGAGNLLPLFEDNIEGKKIGDTFAFSIDPANGYGEYDSEHVAEIPRTIFVGQDNQQFEPKVGQQIPMQDNQGNHFMGLVKSVGAEKVTMDFNHPMAGFNLHFTGEIVGLREATTEELAHGHAHGPGGHHH